MSSDAIQVDAEVVEITAMSKPEMPEVAFRPASIEADFDAMIEWATALKTIYQSADFSEDEQGYREAKAARAAIRTYIRDIDAKRKAVKAEYSAPLVSFEARVKLVTGALGDAADACDSFAKGWEEAGRARKRDAIREAYEDFAPLLAPVLSFDRFYDLRLRAGRKWQNVKPTLPVCIDEMREDVARIAEDLETVRAIQTAHPDVAEREFFRTLDVGQAMRSAKAADDEDARIAAMRAEQERMRAEREAEAARAADARKAVDTAMQETIADEEPPVFEPLPDIDVVERMSEPVGDWVLVLQGATEFTAHRLLDMAVDLCGSGSAVLYQGSPMDAAIKHGMRR